MAFKLVFLAAFVAYVQAGGPAAYSIAALSGDHAYVGSQQEHTVKGLYGQNVVSSYSKAVDSAHSSVRVSNSRQSNDVLGGYHAGYAAPAVVGGYGGYGGYGVSKVVSPVGAYAAPAVYGGAYAHGYNRVVSPVSTVVSHGYAAPTYAAPAYAAGYGVSKVVSPYGLAHAAPAVYGGYGGLGYASKVVAPVAPVSTVVSHGIAAPAYGYSKVVSPTYGVAHASPAVYGGYGAYGHGLGYGVSKVVSPVHSVAAPVYGGYGGYGAYGVSKVVSPVATLGLGHAPVVKTVAPAFTASVVSPGASYSW
ncbi:cuticle protein 21.3 isoform X3 [Sitodiplosis mosellana]|uniref:cuticle protein 21.3 isoform X3 n=1 Tax=Sitodiplosis mosellana TaxID=263140 RepID=UPI00244437E8|nr:cuticle protein 21.3 isoform X3 [Sitodiplosis mosellana]